jgi:2-polyprenyl-6-methoxyphenol hydroxylase-like FAD-dependent oxidoreductase
MNDANQSSASPQLASTRRTRCCIVGAGPAGAMLGLLLARSGVDVVLLESHRDFDRDFRGDTVHPSTLEILDQLGLSERIHALPHGKVDVLRMQTPGGTVDMVDLRRLRTKFPYIMMLPQTLLLELLTAEASRYPNFELILGANVQRLLEADRVTRGVAYRDADNRWHEVHADLTVAADGRFSKIRHLAGIEPRRTAPPMDVMWFRLSRRPPDPLDHATFFVGGGRFAVVLERPEQWQVGYVILKGSFAAVREAGVPAVRTALAELVPWLADRVDELQDWQQVSVLNVESSRVDCWHKPGLLLIGDAAHVMSPVGGVGINYAVQDAVETANLLAKSLGQGPVSDRQLAAVQRRRERPVRFIQRVQRLIQDRIAAPAMDAGRPFKLPLPLRVMTSLPVLRQLLPYIIAYGLRRVRISDEIV